MSTVSVETKVVVKMKGIETEMTMDDARELYLQLLQLFADKRPMVPVPLSDWPPVWSEPIRPITPWYPPSFPDPLYPGGPIYGPTCTTGPEKLPLNPDPAMQEMRASAVAITPPPGQQNG